MTESKNKKQMEYNKKWQAANRDHSNYLKNRSAARSFIRKKAKIEDLRELQKLIHEKLDNI